MLRANFFFKFFKNKENSNHEIIQYNSNQNFALQDQINIKIKSIDQEISENNKALVEAQLVKLKSIFSRSNNFILKIGKNIYKKRLDESIYWHQSNLKELYRKRRELEIKLEKLKGIFWQNRIKRFMKIMVIGMFIFLLLFIFLSGFMIIIYLMPFIILILLVYLIAIEKY